MSVSQAVGGRAVLSFGEREVQIKERIVPLMNSLHSRLRGRDMFPGSSAELESKVCLLREALAGTTADTVMAGGRIGSLGWELVAMGEYLLSEKEDKQQQRPG